ncbi:site-specific integrase [Croceicoccus sp. YJ47]|uniref:tyrosine-type recombinase/integrase n=1 Tax=Croceicoccus sp. YJ47 TaxID=2798724 RepID=UPI0019228D97|nr:site-specific integrase [Croceicoccus sp. YJ47]QQN75847.1 site-specific integrase [Croceicoccus sp. YJ47]
MAIRKRQWTTPKGEAKQAWLVDYRDTAGKRRFKQFTRKKEAEAWFTQAGWEVSKGVHTADSQSVTVAAAADLWIAKAEGECRERGTVQQYRQLANLHIVPLLGLERLSRLSQPRVEAYRDELLKTRSKAMAGKAVRALSSILNEAQRRGLVAQNVAREVKVIRSSREKVKITIPTRDELKALLNHADDDFRPLVMTAVFTGLRASELRGLRWSDLDLKAGSITVTQRADKFGQIGAPKSEAGHRTVPIPPALVTELKAWKLRSPKGDMGLTFPNTRGGVQNYEHMLRRKFFPLQIAAGVCDVSGSNDEGEPILKARYGFHALRHAAASAWIKQRIDLKRLQVWMGHSSIQITLDTYGHLLADASGDAALIAATEAELLG